MEVWKRQCEDLQVQYEGDVRAREAYMAQVDNAAAEGQDAGQPAFDPVAPPEFPPAPQFVNPVEKLRFAMRRDMFTSLRELKNAGFAMP